MTNSFREPSADELKLEWPSDDPVDERGAMTLFDQDHPTDAAAAAPQPDLYDQLTEDALARDARPSSFFDGDRLPADDDWSSVDADRLAADPSRRFLRRSARKGARRRRVLIAVMAAITVPLGVGAGLWLAPSDEGSRDEGPPAAADGPTRPVFDGTIRLPNFAVEPVAAIAPPPGPAPAAAPAGAPTTSFIVPSSAPSGAPPTTTAAAAAQPPAPSQPAPPPTTTAAPPPSAPASNPNPVCSVLPVLCQ
jgi:hypothetical protein